jgi:hypothetical protein
VTSIIYKFRILNSALEEVKDDLSEYTSASTLKRIILYVDLGSKIKACTVKLDFAMQLFQVMPRLLKRRFGELEPYRNR